MSRVRHAVHGQPSVRRADGVVGGRVRRLLQLRKAQASRRPRRRCHGQGNGAVLMTTISLPGGATCPVPLAENDRVQLGHGSGGQMSAALIRDRFLPLLDNPVLRQLGDAGVVPVHGGEIAISTDTFVVSPVEFPGGNIGSLAVHGTLNDLAMMGARPRFLSTGFILEEGLPFDVLDRAIAAMANAARDHGIMLVAGDTKVVERGRADGLYVNTTG